jgi:hypothetical protein
MGGTFSATNIQWADDLQWLGQVVVASSTAIQKQQQADVIARGKQLTAQDNNLAATAKQANAATCQQRVATEYPSATLNLPNGTTLQPSIPNVCASGSGAASQAGSAIAAVTVASNSFMDQSALTAANVSALHNWDNGDHNATKSVARNILANKDNVSSLSAVSDLLAPNTTGIQANKNAGNYITIVNDPTPPPQLSTQVQNTVAGKAYLGNKRVYGADMSLANDALFFIADKDVPTISIASIKSMMATEAASSSTASTSSATSSTSSSASKTALTVAANSPSFMKDLLAISQSEGVAGYASVNTFLAAYAEGYFLSPKWYTKVEQNAGNAAFYNKTSAYMGGFSQEMAYLQTRVNEYKTALLAQMSALNVQQHYKGKLDVLRARATSSQ